MTTDTPTQAADREARREVAAFNAKTPPGSPVLAWPGLRGDDVEPLRTRTRGSAWVLSSGEPLVSVEGHAGGIALTHVELDPTRPAAVPDVAFESPPCPMCGDALDTDGDALVCESCDASWDSNGTHGTWTEPDAVRCLATRSWDHPDLPTVEQCARPQGHPLGRIVGGGAHIPGDGLGAWVDGDQCALTDGEGEQLRGDA